MQRKPTNRLTRRHFSKLSAASFLLLMTSGIGTAVSLSQIQKSLGYASQEWGTTFSQLQCYYLGLDYRQAFQQICSLGLSRIRLCSYWHELEPIEQAYNFTVIDWLLDQSHKHGIEVVLTVGMKAPRWPEFHFPDWLQAQYDIQNTDQPIDANPAIADRTLKLIERLMTHTRHVSSVKYWQVENEPLLPLEISAGRFLSPEFLRQEVELVRSLARPEQKVLITTAINLPDPLIEEDNRAFQTSLKLADAIGINVYTKVPDGENSYLEPTSAYWQMLKTWRQALANHHKEAWISELQAEPWEPNQLVAIKQVDYPSASPQQVTSLVETLQNIGYATVMLWGCEYWYWHQQQGRNHWWQGIQQLIET